MVDTVLVKILAESEQTAELYTLIDEANDIVLSEVIEPLLKNGQYNALCKLYEKHGDEESLLEALSKYILTSLLSNLQLLITSFIDWWTVFGPMLTLKIHYRG